MIGALPAQAGRILVIIRQEGEPFIGPGIFVFAHGGVSQAVDAVHVFLVRVPVSRNGAEQLLGPGVFLPGQGGRGQDIVHLLGLFLGVVPVAGIQVFRSRLFQQFLHLGTVGQGVFVRRLRISARFRLPRFLLGVEQVPGFLLQRGGDGVVAHQHLPAAVLIPRNLAPEDDRVFIFPGGPGFRGCPVDAFRRHVGGAGIIAQGHENSPCVGILPVVQQVAGFQVQAVGFHGHAALVVLRQCGNDLPGAGDIAFIQPHPGPAHIRPVRDPDRILVIGILPQHGNRGFQRFRIRGFILGQARGDLPVAFPDLLPGAGEAGKLVQGFQGFCVAAFLHGLPGGDHPQRRQYDACQHRDQQKA